MGGNVPLGYVVKDRKLVVSRARGGDRPLDLRAVRPDRLGDGAGAGAAGRGRAHQARQARRQGLPLQAAEQPDLPRAWRCTRARRYPGEHAAIIDQDLWDKVHAILAENARTRSANTRAQTPALLKGLIFGPTGAAMSPTHTRKGNRLYRYYVSQDVLKRGPDACPVGRVPAAEIEAAVIDQLRGIFRQPEIIVGTWRAARAEQDDITEDEAREALTAARPAVGRAVPGRAGADRAAAGRAGRRADARRRGPAAAERARRAGARGGGQQEGGGVTRATVSADGETITVHIPLTFRKRGGRKLVVTPDGAEWAPRPRVDNAMVKALARAFRWRKMLDDGRARDAGGPGEGEGRRRRPTSAGSCGSRCSRRRSSRRSSTGGSRRSCSWMICWRGFRWSGRGSTSSSADGPVRTGSLCQRVVATILCHAAAPA